MRPGRGRDRPIIPILLMLLMLPFSSAAGMGTWNTSGSDFRAGTITNAVVENDALRLDMNRSGLDNWTLVSDGSPPGDPWLGLVMFYDGRRGVIFLVDFDHSLPNVPTWAYDLADNKWSTVDSNLSNPPYWDYCGGAFDSVHDIFFVTDGANTWTYRMSDGSWTDMKPAYPPPVRRLHSVAYDSVNDRMVLYGGLDPPSSNYKNDTWTYDISTNTWQEMSPAASPPKGVLGPMVFSQASGESIFFDGVSSETWTYNLTSNRWINRTYGYHPSYRHSYSMSYDDWGKKIVLFGGFGGYASSPGSIYNDTWWYDVETHIWINKTTMGGPQARMYHMAVYDGMNKKTVLFGGVNRTARFADTWAYDTGTNTWANKVPTSFPYGRRNHAMVYDPHCGVSVMFGGDVGDNPATVLTAEYLNDVWLYNSSLNSWTNRQPSPAPAGRVGPGMVYDGGRGQIIMFGGEDTYGRLLNDTWTYDVDADRWTELHPQGAPPGRYLHSMAYDDANGEVVIFGGWNDRYPLADTWTYEYSSNTWKEMAPPQSPPPGHMNGFAYDGASGLSVLSGSSDNMTWTYNASAGCWSANDSPYGEEMRDECVKTVYDPGGCRLIVYSGRNSLYFYNLSLDSWTKKTWPEWQMWARGYAISIDILAKELILFGGHYTMDESNIAIDDVRIYNLTAYFSSGTCTSPPYDTRGSAFFGDIRWGASTPDGTRVYFQLRAANSSDMLNSTRFTGPDGTSDSFYFTSGHRIGADLNGSRWVQYRAFLDTSIPTRTPELKSVTINFNLRQNLTVTAPATAENWTGTHNITWTASDPDGDPLSFDIFLENDTASVPLAIGLANQSRRWPWDTDATRNGTYRIRISARDDNPSIPLFVNAVSVNFTIHHPVPPVPPNHAPNVSLISPPDKAVLNTTSVRLQWKGTDPDGDPLVYTVRYSDRPLEEIAARTMNATAEYLEPPDLADNTTYYWTVDAFDGKPDSSDVPTDVWSFTIRIPPINHPVIITSTPEDTAWVGAEYSYNLTWIDADGDAVIFTIVSAPSNVTIGTSTGRLRWIPSTADIGNRTIVVQVSDGRGSTDRQAFNITVMDIPVQPKIPPKCAITYPANGARVKGTIQVKGTAINGSLPLTAIRIRIDGGNWTSAAGLDSWSHALDTSNLAKGAHIIEARAFDAGLSSDTASVNFTVVRPAPGVSSGSNSWCVPAAVIAAIACAVALMPMKKRGR